MGLAWGVTLDHLLYLANEIQARQISNSSYNSHKLSFPLYYKFCDNAAYPAKSLVNLQDSRELAHTRLGVSVGASNFSVYSLVECFDKL